MKSIFNSLVIAAVMLLTGCNGYYAQVDQHNLRLADCEKNNFHAVEFVDSGGQTVQMRIQKSCTGFAIPKHPLDTALVPALAGVASAVVVGEYNKDIAETNLRAALSRDSTLRAAIDRASPDISVETQNEPIFVGDNNTFAPAAESNGDAAGTTTESTTDAAAPAAMTEGL